MQNEVVTDGYELSPQQTRIWLLQQADGSHAYKAQSAVLMEGMIDVETLKTAISEVVARHEILHINFHLLPGMRLPLQTIKPDQVIEFREIDLNEFDLQEKQTRFEELFRKEARHRFDLRYEPIARFCLVRLSISERVLVTNLPSVCVDSRSLKNLFREIARTYSACLRGEKLSDRPIQYVDFAEWQEEILGEEQADDLDERWDRQNPYLCSPSQLMLGVELDSRLGFGFDPDYISFTLDPEITIKIDRISSIHNISSDVFLLACWQILIWRFTGRKDIAIDNLCEGRSVKELWESLGTFARFCPIQSHLEPSYQFTDVFEIADQSLRSANERFNHILRRDSMLINDGCLADRANAIGFEYEEWPRVEYAGSVKFSYWRQHCCIDRFKLKLGGYLKAEGLTIELHYDTAIFSRASIVLIGERYLRLIESAVEGVQTLIGNYEGRQDEYLKVNGYQIEDAIRAGEKNERQLLVKVSREGRLPLSFAQQRLWFIDQLEPGGAIYNVPTALRVRGELRRELLESALGEVVRRHESLRTRFEIREAQPAQIIDQASPVGAPVIDVSGLEEGQREKEARRIAGEEAARGFDLGRGPLLRAGILRLGEQDQALLFTMHHIVSDGWSTGVLINEVNRLYEAYGRGESSPLEELPIQYADYAVWQRQWLKAEVLELELEYWRKQLAGMETLELPADHPRPAVRSDRGAKLQFVVARELTEKLRELGRREGVTLFMLLLGGFDVLMSRYSGQEDVALGTDIANRNLAEIEGLIGFFVNQLALRVEVRHRESFEELLKRVREVCLGAYAHQDVPFEKLVEELQPERDLSRSPLFQVKLILQNAPREGLKLGGTRLSEVGGGEIEMAKVDLTAAITDTGRDLAVVVSYSRDLFEEETIERLARHYTNLLSGIAEDSERPISELSLLSDEEREQIVVEWNQTGQPYPQDRCVHELFREQAERNPERIALTCEERWVSYRELNRRANQLARYLQGLGVGPEVAVGICLERSVEMAVALLGVFKAGGAYLPLDPESPLERLGYMLEEAGVGVALTERRLEKRLPSFWGQTVSMDAEWERIGAESEGEPDSVVIPENLAYVIYTSGSTGRPKGVMITHKGLANYLHWASEAYRIEEGEGAPVQSSIGFDLTVTSLYGPLVNGKRVNLLPEGEGIEALATALRKERGYSLVKITPAHLEVLAQQMRNVEVEGRAKALVIGGEELRAVGLNYWQERAPGTRLINEY
ncbi:MAG TPA: condensation domain-containing protein, partial [Candidatus Bathyarchaeia archaeon]